MSRTITEAEMASRRKCAAVVGDIWDAIGTASEKHGELTGWEWAWCMHEIHGRFIAIELNRERTGEVDPTAD